MGIPLMKLPTNELIKKLEKLQKKEKPKNVIKQGLKTLCPTCKIDIDLINEFNKICYCTNCGQRLDWNI